MNITQIEYEKTNQQLYKLQNKSLTIYTDWLESG